MKKTFLYTALWLIGMMGTLSIWVVNANTIETSSTSACTNMWWHVATLTEVRNLLGISGNGNNKCTSSDTFGLWHPNGYCLRLQSWYFCLNKVYDDDDWGNPYNCGSNYYYNLLTGNPSSNTMYYLCIYNPIPYTVTYYQWSNLLGSSNHTYGTAKNLTTYTTLWWTIPNGWTFAWWSNSQNGTTVNHTDGKSVKNLTSEENWNVDLYAVFQRMINIYWGINKQNNSKIQYYNPTNNTNITSITLPNVSSISNWTWLWYRTDTETNVATINAWNDITPAYNETPSNYYAVYSRKYDAKFYSNINKSTQNTKSSDTLYYNTNTSSIPTTVNVTLDSAENSTDIENWTELWWRDDTMDWDKEYDYWTVQIVPWSTNFYNVYSRTLTVNYDWNGSTQWSTDNTEKIIYMNSNDATTSDQAIMLADNWFSREWYRFSKWNIWGTEYTTWANYNPNLSYNATVFGVTAIAQWTANTYQIKFDAWDWTWTMDNQEFTYDVAQNLTDNAFTKTGYTFSGWSDWTTWYTNQQNVINLTTTNNDIITFTAQWAPIIYTIVFSWNADDAQWTQASINAEYDSGDIAPESNFTLTGYTFTWWNTQSDWSGTWYATWDTLINLTTTGGDTVTLYAQWEANIHKLSFVVDWTTIRSGDVAYSTAISAPADPTKDSCNSFAGWTSSVEWLTTTGTMPDSDVTFTANWNYTCSKSSGWWGGGGGSSKTTTTSTTWTVTTWTNETNVKADTQDEENQEDEAEWETQEDKDEFQRAYEFAYKHGITTMPTIEEANMTWTLTRIAMAKMLSYYAINILWMKPDETRVNKFNDVSEKLNAEYNNAVTLAYQLWIMWINMPKNNFRPNDLVTRWEFATALSRMLYGIEDWKDKYYSTHLAKLMEEKIITNDDPKMKELRGYVMIMLMRSAENKSTGN